MSIFEGAAANFLAAGDNLLQIGLPDVARSEAQAIRKGSVKGGFIKDGPLILWVFVFGTIIFDCPFDSRLIKREELRLPNIDNDRQRLTIDIHLVDTATNLLSEMRMVTISPSLSLRFLSAVQEQLIDQRSTEPFLARYNNLPIERVPVLAKVERLGV